MAEKASSSREKDREKELADLMEELGIGEEDLDDVIYEEEGSLVEEAPR
jgi:hypothetical protein